MPRRTLQARIKKLVDDEVLVRVGERRGTRYFNSNKNTPEPASSIVPEAGSFVPISKDGKDIQKLISRPAQIREPVDYDHSFLEKYVPNHTYYLTEEERNHLYTLVMEEMPPHQRALMHVISSIAF